MKKRILVAMSGGVDSSLSALLLKEQGYDVIGVTLKLFEGGESQQKDIDDAKRIANKLNFPHYVLDRKEIFKHKILDYFVSSYQNAETPIPCALCNRYIKFGELIKFSQELGAQGVATGHYAKIIEKDGIYQLMKSEDTHKDQTYFLFYLRRKHLPFIKFPLGSMKKKDTRKQAMDAQLNVHDKAESKDICFLQGKDYRTLINKFKNNSVKPGIIRHISGEILNTKGVFLTDYTIGQRKGINIGGRKDDTSALYVIRLDKKNNELIVGNKEHLKKATIYIKNINWLAKSFLKKNIDIKYRSTMNQVPGKLLVNSHDKNRASFSFLTPQSGIAYGQGAVFYHGDRIIGGGLIEDIAVSNITNQEY